MNRRITLTEYVFTAQEPTGFKYEFLAGELPNGEVRVSCDTCSDGWFANLDSVQANGEDTILSYEATERAFSWTEDDLRKSVTGSAREFGLVAIPESLHRWIDNE